MRERTTGGTHNLQPGRVDSHKVRNPAPLVIMEECRKKVNQREKEKRFMKEGSSISADINHHVIIYVKMVPFLKNYTFSPSHDSRMTWNEEGRDERMR